MPTPRRLIEVDLPIRRISAQARREKSIRHGHISTLHIWWARRPLAACRAVLCAALWPDPADCPAFHQAALPLLRRFAQQATADQSLVNEESFGLWLRLAHERDWAMFSPQAEHGPTLARQALLAFIADFANWDHSAQSAYLEAARALTQAAHLALGGPPDARPLVVDPFAGGGAIPLEALRVGAEAFASDLNPVAVLLNKVTLEYIPRYGAALAEAVRRWGGWIKAQAEAQLRPFYPQDEDGSTPIAYLWARTITCGGPNCGAEVPLLRALWLAKKPKKSVALRMRGDAQARRVEFEVVEVAQGAEFEASTVRRGAAICPCCGYTTPVEQVRAQLKARRGGAADARLLAVVTARPGQVGRAYRLPTPADLEAAQAAQAELRRRQAAHTGPLSLIPDEPLPLMSGTFNVPLYGMESWGDLFTPRQALALATLSGLVGQVGQHMQAEGQPPDFIEAVQTCLALAMDKQADSNSSLCAWRSTSEDIGHTFGRQALPMVWDFVEANIFSGATRDWMNAVEGTLKSIESIDDQMKPGQAVQASATDHRLSDDSIQVYATDPPYYNAVPYADLSDFFYVWLNRTVRSVHPSLFSEALSPKSDELCEMSGWDPERYAHKDSEWYRIRMGQAMAEGRRVLAPDGIGVVVFAHKSTAGWEAQLQAMLEAGWIITASWPIDTEMGTRLRAQDSAALASSIHLVCRPREDASGQLSTEVGDWREVLAELPRRIAAWLPRLARENVVGADAIFACLGPAMEIYSRYARVEKANGEQVFLREYLEEVWAAISRQALSIVFEGADTSGFEEDARLTAMWLWTLQREANLEAEASQDEADEADEGSAGQASRGGYELEYDAARKIAQGLGARLEKLGHLVRIKGSTATLLRMSERAEYLFGGALRPTTTARAPRPRQRNLFELVDQAQAQGFAAPHEADEALQAALGGGRTTLDRVHQAALLHATARTEALRRFLVEDGIGREGRFWRLADALLRLYPPTSEERRWLEGLLARKKVLGL